MTPEEREKERERLMREYFEPAELSKKFLTKRDKSIKVLDVPERLQPLVLASYFVLVGFNF